MAIEKTYLLGKNITLGCGFDLQAKAPLDSRQVVPEYDGLQALIDGNAAYEGMIVYDEGTKKTYQAQIVDGVLAFREFGINEAELKDLIASETTAAMEFKGAATALPENPAKGDFYKVTTSFDVAEGETAKVGDSIVYDGEQWFLIPSGDDIEDTWRPVTDVDNDATLTFAAGDKLDVAVAANGTVTYSHEAIDTPTATPVGEDEQTRTYITSVETDGHGHITGYKTATENVEDTNTEYTFEGLPVGEDEEAPSSVYFQVTPKEEGASAEVVYLDAYSKNEADDKFVAKETGKSLVSDDEIARLADVDNYDDEEVRGFIGDNAKAIEDLEKYVGTIPSDEAYKDIADVIGYVNKKAEETLAAASGNSTETAASVKQQLDNYKSENNTRVKAIEDDVAAIKDAETGILKQAQDYADGLADNCDEKGAAADVQAALEVEIAKKVAKEDYEADKATFATKTDIEKLAGVSEGANKTEKSETNGNIKIDGQEVVVYAHPEKHTIDDVTGVQDAIDDAIDTLIINRVHPAEGKITDLYNKTLALENASATHATKTEVQDVDAKFADYNTTATQKAIDDAQDARIKAIEDNYLVEADIANFETKENVKKVADDLAAYVESNDVAVALKADKSVVDGMYTNEQIDAAILVETNRAKGVEEGLQTQINTIMSNPDAEGAINSINEFTQYVKDHGTIADGFRTDIDKNKEDIAANTKAIEDEATRADTAEKALAGRLDTLEAIDHEAYVAADTAVLEAAKTDASNKDAVVLSEAQKYADQAKADAIADAEGKVNALAETLYTKAEVDALLSAAHTWGEF